MSRRFTPLKRRLNLTFPENPVHGSGAVFLWGPRQTGKTTLLKERYPEAFYVDLLDTDREANLSVRPASLREEILAGQPSLVIVDEIQKVPRLLEEVHWLLENSSTRFILCGSSARKLKRGASNLLGGRATEARLFPLVSDEIPGLDLDRFLNHGGLPAYYLHEDPSRLLKSYINTYIKEEIIDESLVRNIPSFSAFLDVVGLTHGRQLNYANVAREAGVSAATVRNYYQILEDTLMGFTLSPWRKKRKRRLVETAKFFLFDVGVANHLHPEHHQVQAGSDRYGRAFEHFMLGEIRAWCSYRGLDWRLTYWRTSSGFEVDLVVGDMEHCLEFKSTSRIRQSDLKGLRALCQEHEVGRSWVISKQVEHRKTEDGIEQVFWADFLKRLWAGELL